MEESYDAAVTEYFQPYHHFVDKLLRFGFNHDRVADQVIACSKCLCCPAIICVKHNNKTTKKRKKKQQQQGNTYEFCHSGTAGRSLHASERTAVMYILNLNSHGNQL